jgi:acylphosphatase
MKAIKIEIYGRVQGVGFRHSAVKTAKQHNVKGFVKNNTDGSVSIFAEGKEDKLNDFVKWCHEGPGFAQVHDVKVENKEARGFEKFDVKY